ncbi:glycosyltransferase [Amycolatopsis sp. NPDC049868]|uniref:glycosyltransferase n=1 Tax=Amycolatopsis sp. NPDC049868 TaxID=3363934 RepID=UPI0037B36338
MTRLLIITTGSHGDHAPYAGLGQALQRHGVRVTLAATSRFEQLALDAGIGFAALPDDPEPIEATERGHRANAGGARGLRALVELGVEQARRQLPSLIAAAADADVIAATIPTLLQARPIAEAHGVPLVVLPLQPALPTREFSTIATRDLGPALNRTLSTLAGRFASRLYAPVVREVRQSLDLPPEDRRQATARIDSLPVLHGFSPAVQARPHDWRPGAEVVGYWWPVAGSRRPRAELLDFLAAGPPPVFIGFGSMATGHTTRLGTAVADALARTGHRAVVQRGWADLRIDTTGPNVITVDHVPHEWLFLRVAAVVHHAGAGTTAAALRAGVPSVPVPHAHDQPFWARRLVALGTAPAVLPAGRADGSRLARCLVEATGSPRYRDNAARIASAVASDDAVTPVLRMLRQLTEGKATA